ncbi:unnamed protein product [Haemonchus placei]|uniref:Nucleoporin NUP53 n=1 Tax=Haemonchus placei TaxID=6290 RepID=A0A0N4W399_HAEPC|nr:unnamed protein product [Haemonchus placei]
MFSDVRSISTDELTTTGNASLSGNFGVNDHTEQSVPSFLRTPSEMDVSGSMCSVAFHLASPQSSVNNSIVSEMTTPKMLGLPKKGPSSSGGNRHPSRMTPTGLDAQNPYAEVFSRSSSLQKYSNRTPTMKANAFSGIRSSLAGLSSKSPTTPGYVTTDSIIPRVNAPSSMARNNF